MFNTFVIKLFYCFSIIRRSIDRQVWFSSSSCCWRQSYIHRNICSSFRKQTVFPLYHTRRDFRWLSPSKRCWPYGGLMFAHRLPSNIGPTFIQGLVWRVVAIHLQLSSCQTPWDNAYVLCVHDCPSPWPTPTTQSRWVWPSTLQSVSRWRNFFLISVSQLNNNIHVILPRFLEWLVRCMTGLTSKHKSKLPQCRINAGPPST